MIYTQIYILKRGVKTARVPSPGYHHFPYDQTNTRTINPPLHRWIRWPAALHVDPLRTTAVLPEAGRSLGVIFDGRQVPRQKRLGIEKIPKNPYEICAISTEFLSINTEFQLLEMSFWQDVPNPKTTTNTRFLLKKKRHHSIHWCYHHSQKQTTWTSQTVWPSVA